MKTISDEIKLLHAVKSPDFNRDFSNHYALSIVLKDQYIGYSICDTRNNQVLAFRKSTGQFSISNGSVLIFLKQYLKENADLQLLYKQVNIAIFSPYFTIIPNQFNNDAAGKEFLHYTFRDLENHGEVITPITAADASIACFCPDFLLNFFRENFQHTNIIHSAAPVIDHLSKINKNCNDSNKIYVAVNEETVEIFAFKSNKWHFYNAFNFKTSEDFLYYVLLVYNQLGLNPEEDPMVFISEIEQQSALYNAAYKYIKEIKFGKRPDVHHFAPAFDELPKHYYFNLFCL